MSESWIARDYANALAQLEEALATPAQSDLLKAGCMLDPGGTESQNAALAPPG